jgi:hypothetical protein
MAYLILNEEEKYAAGEMPEDEKFYEFDPNDKTAVTRIHAILSLRKNGPIAKSEHILAEVCTHSLEQTSSTTGASVNSWFQLISEYLPKPISKNRLPKKKTIPKFPALSSNSLSSPYYPK